VSPAEEAELIGVVNTNEPRWIQKMRAERNRTPQPL